MGTACPLFMHIREMEFFFRIERTAENLHTPCAGKAYIEKRRDLLLKEKAEKTCKKRRFHRRPI
jgi:hypothetical protein